MIVDGQHPPIIFYSKACPLVEDGKYVKDNLSIHYMQSFQVLIQYKLLRYLSSSTSTTGGSGSGSGLGGSSSSNTNNTRNEMMKKTGYSVLRNGTEQNAPVALTMPVCNRNYVYNYK